jgi:hypothetical protein
MFDIFLVIIESIDKFRFKFLSKKLVNLFSFFFYNFRGPPPDWNGPAPGKGCEIFVGKVPRDAYEYELVRH